MIELSQIILISVIAFSLGYYTRHKIKGLTVLDRIDKASETLQTASEGLKVYKPQQDTIQDRTTKSRPSEELSDKERAELEEARKWKKTDESYESTFNLNKRNRDKKYEIERAKISQIKEDRKEAEEQLKEILFELSKAETALKNGEGLEALKKDEKKDQPQKPSFLK